MIDAVPTPGLEALRFFNTRTRTVEPFVPLVPGKVGIYTCGPTVYAPQHIGNMRSQFLPDLLRRVLTAAGYEVTFVTNITDVGHLTDDADEGVDKMEMAAQRTGHSAAEISARFTEQWANDRRRLGMLEPDLNPRAAAHIPEQIELIERLETGGHTYVINDGVYFDVTTFPAYADFAGLDLDDQDTSGRVGNIADKRNPADFALWKFSPEGTRRQQEWDSPWGRGFPGWHIECSAMATKYLGERFDIHTGGVDHIGVHHTNEIAQSECALGVHPWVSLWMHMGFLNLAGEKMAKSTGSLLVLDDVVARGIDPLALRYFFLQAHYRQQQSFTSDALEAAATAHRRLVQHAVRVRDAGGEPDLNRVEPLRRRFWEHMADDLNAPRALGVVWEVVRSPELTPADRWWLLADFDRLLGFGLAQAVDPDTATAGSGTDSRIDALVEQREVARKERDFAAADRIRVELAAENVLIVDTPSGPTWHRK